MKYLVLTAALMMASSCRASAAESCSGAQEPMPQWFRAASGITMITLGTGFLGAGVYLESDRNRASEGSGISTVGDISEIFLFTMAAAGIAGGFYTLGSPGWSAPRCMSPTATTISGDSERWRRPIPALR